MDGSLYLLIDQPYKVDRLGNLMPNIYPTEPIVMNGNKMKTPPGFSSKEPYAKHRVSATDINGFRPEPSGSMHDLSGHPATEVPPEPLLSTSVLSVGTPTRNRTKPSHFQKWVTKFDGTCDPYDHLASFK